VDIFASDVEMTSEAGWESANALAAGAGVPGSYTRPSSSFSISSLFHFSTFSLSCRAIQFMFDANA